MIARAENEGSPLPCFVGNMLGQGSPTSGSGGAAFVSGSHWALGFSGLARSRVQGGYLRQGAKQALHAHTQTRTPARVLFSPHEAANVQFVCAIFCWQPNARYESRTYVTANIHVEFQQIKRARLCLEVTCRLAYTLVVFSRKRGS